MRRVHLISLAAIAMIGMSAIGGIGASSALATGPLWLVEGEGFSCSESAGGAFDTLLECLGGPHETGTAKWASSTSTIDGSLGLDEGALVLASSLGVAVIKAGGIITIECTNVHNQGSIEGGVPGKDHEYVVFSSCSIAGHPSCDISSSDQELHSGIVTLHAKTELVLLEPEGGLAHNLLDLFEPASGETFLDAVLTPLASGACPIFTAGETEVKGNVAAFIEPETENPVSEGMLRFPKEPVKAVYRWKKEGKFEKVSVALKAFGVIGVSAAGLADVSLEHGGQASAHCGCQL